MRARGRAWAWIHAKMTLHKLWVAHYLLRYAARASSPAQAARLILRALRHDLSKYRPAEAVAFVDWFLLSEPCEASAGYASVLRSFDRQVELHYARNRHHPEHHALGYRSMSELDRIEMVADWAAAARRLGPPASVERWIADRAETYGYDREEADRLRAIAVRMGATDARLSAPRRDSRAVKGA